MDRQLDSTLLVTRAGLQVLDGTSPVHFKCGREWAVYFTENGQTVTLETRAGQWTITGISSEVAVAAVNEGAPLVSSIAESVGVSDVEDVTSRTLDLANTFASSIGLPSFDEALGAAVDAANEVLDDNGIHPIDFNDDILSAIALLGPSGGVLDASDTTVEDVQREASHTIGLVLNALASSGTLSNLPQMSADGDASDVVATATTPATPAEADDAATTDATVADTTAADATAAAAISAGVDPAVAAAAAAAAGADVSKLSPADAAALAAAVAGGK